MSASCFLRHLVTGLVSAGLLVAGRASAGPNAVASDARDTTFARRLHERFPSTVDAVVVPSFPGFRAVIKDGQVVHVKEDLTFMITGDVVDLKTNQSLSSKLLEAHRPKLAFASLPLDQAIRFGTGSRRLVVFSDPDCPFCRRVEAELAQLKDTSVYILPFPIAGHPEAAGKARSIWCAADPAQAWRDYMLQGKEPAAAACKNPIEDNVALAKRLGVTATPTLIFEDGTVMPGAVSAARIEAQLGATRR